MSDPIQFPEATSRYGLPLLFAGQAQKEFFVNMAISRCDALIQLAILGEVTAPPVDPADGDCWLVASGATGEFAGRDGHLALREGTQWSFVAPHAGMRAFDTSAEQFLLHSSGWQREAALAVPSGGQMVDAEARTSINELIAVLQRSGILPPN